ncbi:MAG: penicillin-binding protein 1C [Bacteroidetes bacterium]|nr:penicillin-binding protein 1C [Bacteroidota bacterium]
MVQWIARHKYLLITTIVISIGFLSLPVVSFSDPTNTVLEDSRGELLSARITADGQWRFPECDSVPFKLYQSIRYYEDQHFRSHPGINPVSLTKALFRNIKERRVVSGGSTITMQVVRLSRKGRPRTVTQKSIEMALALRLEFSLDKEKIFRLYASHAPFGGNVVGMDAASWRYYGRPAFRLSWGEAATLAVLPNAPSLIYPGKNREKLLAKRNRLLEKLEEKGVLDPTGCDLAKSEPLPGKPHPLPQISPHLLDRAEKEGHRGERIVTSIDKGLQERITSLVERHHQHLKQNEIHNAAVLILNIPERKVIAYVGNTRSDDEGSGRYVDIIGAPRSSGSILKPLLFTLMLDEGEILPDNLVPDIPTHISGYSPLNFDRTYSGAVPASTALVRSLNVPAVRMLRAYGLDKFHSKLQTLGFNSINQGPGHYGLTLILGGAEVSLWELGQVYMGMANSLNHIREYEYRYDPGEYLNPSYLWEDREYQKEDQPDLARSGMMSAGAIWQCFETLTELERPTQEGSWERFSSSKTIAWKTGTSFGYRDAWAIGLNPDYLVGVWVGNADGEGRPGLTGVNAAAPLMFEAFGLLNSSAWFEPAYDEMTEIDICTSSGFRAGPDCKEVEIRMVPAAGERVEACPYHRTIHLDQHEQFRVHSDCYDIDRMVSTPWFVLPPVMEWYYKRRDPHYQTLPPFAPGCEEADEQAMELIYPRETRQIFIPRGLDGQLSRVVFEAAHRNAEAVIHWHLDEHYLGETSLIHQVEFLAPGGWHTLTLVDSDGNILEKQFELVINQMY